MYLTAAESRSAARSLAGFSLPEGIRAAVFPNTLAFSAAADELGGSYWQLGAQNVDSTPQGAYTGATSALMFKEAGAVYALVGHSERRHIFGETDEAAHNKTQACLDAGLIPVVCVGESESDRKEDKRQYRLKKQLFQVFTGLNLPSGAALVAYEPVWAIGSGEPCAPADADDVAGWIKLELSQSFGLTAAVLYGGSVTPDNVAGYLEREAIDGVLSGSASTRPDSVAAMLAAVEGSG